MTRTRLRPFHRLRRLAAVLGAGPLVGLGCCHADYDSLFPDRVHAAVAGPAPACCAPAAASPAVPPPHAAPLPAVPPWVSAASPGAAAPVAALPPPGAPALVSGHEPGWLPRVTSPGLPERPDAPRRATAVADAPPAGGVRTVAYKEKPDAAATPAVAPTGPAPHALPPAVAAAPHVVSIDLDTVLRMTADQNLQIVLARKRADEALLAADCGGCGLGGLLRHRADSAGEDSADAGCGGRASGGHGESRRLKAMAQYWQRRAELARTAYETLLDAGNTYVDLLTARRGEAVGRELEKYQQDLLRRAEKLAESDRSATALVEGVRGELEGRRQALAKLRQQGDAAAEKLVYLLDLPPGSRVVPVDATLNVLDLVDVGQPVEALVAKAQADGPGVHELEALIGVIQEGIAEGSSGLKARLPSVQCQVKLAEAKLDQTRVALADTRAKLALGVREAREAVLSGREQVAAASEQIRHAAETYRLANTRFKENAPNASASEVSQSIRGLELAHFNYLSAVSAYDKAELRLLLLLGMGPDCKNGPAGHAAVLPPAAAH